MNIRNRAKSLLGVVLIVILFIPHSIRAQFIEDALRLDYGGFGVGARALAMGTAYVAVSNDFTASFWNPAGLAQMRSYEFSTGLSNISFNNNARYIGSQTEYSTSATHLNNIGIVIPVPTIQGSLTFAFGYNRSNDFTSSLAFDAFSTNSSIIPSLYHPDEELDLAYQLWLDDFDLIEPIRGQVHQSGTVIEQGGTNNWSLAGGIEAVKDFYLGASINFLSGDYQYDRIFNEYDRENYYADFREFEVNNRISGDITGFNLRLGALYKPNKLISVGATIKPPSRYSIEEQFSSFGESWFDIPPEGANAYNTYTIRGSTDYDVVTPWSFGAGASIQVVGLTLAGSVEYTDWTQLEFRNAELDVIRENQVIKDILEPTLTLRVGGEYIIPGIDLALRAGYFVQPSPYKEDLKSYDRTYITAGAGFMIQDVITLDFAYARGTWDTHRIHYFNSPRIDEEIIQNSVLITIGYRF